MKDSNQDITLLTHDEMCGYWNGTLSPRELERVEKAILNCPFCAEALEGYKYIVAEEEQNKVQQFLNQQQKISYQSTTPIFEEDEVCYAKTKLLKKKKTIIRYLSYGIAASLLLLLIPITIFFHDSFSKQDLFSTNYIPYQNDIIEKVRSDKTLSKRISSQLEDALIHYDNKAYNSSITTFQRILKKKKNSDALFFQSMAYIETSAFDKAIEQLNVLKNDEKYRNHSLWYLAMIYLKKEEFENAKTNLKILAKNKGKNYSGKAANILEALK